MNGKEVINMILANESIKAATFARKIGVTPPQIYDLQKGKIKGISSNIADKIIAIYPKYNKTWLITGMGEMLVQQTEEEKEEKVSINIANLTKLAGMPNIVDIPEHLEAPKIKSINIVEGFSEKLVKLGYEKPVDEKGYKVIALDLADRLNRMASMSEDMVGIVSKPLLDRIGLVDKQRILAESRVAELEAKIAAMEIKAAK